MSDISKHKRYLREMGGALLLYVVMLVISLRVGSHMEQGPGQTLVYISPMLGFFLGIRAVVRSIRRSDEFQRKILVEHFAITAGITAGWTFTYGFLENAGFPKLSMFSVWPVMGAIWCFLSVREAFRNRPQS